MSRRLSPEAYGFRRRCSWCAVTLRGWQLNLCRRCGKAVRWDAPGPPVGMLSRADEMPDRWLRISGT